MTDREAFEAWHSRNYDTLPGTELHRVERQGMQKAWIAALASERKKAALSAITNADEDDVTSERAKLAVRQALERLLDLEDDGLDWRGEARAMIKEYE